MSNSVRRDRNRTAKKTRLDATRKQRVATLEEAAAARGKRRSVRKVRVKFS